MKLHKLIDEAVKTGKIIYVDGWCEGMKYHPELKCFVWCDTTGKFADSMTDYYKRKRVIFSPEIMKEDGWELINAVPDFQIGDKIYVESILTERILLVFCAQEAEIINITSDKKYEIRLHDPLLTLTLTKKELQRIIQG